MNKVFFDTNILFYAYNTADPIKQKKAQELFISSIADGSGFSSVQVLGEFFHSTVIRKKVLTVDEGEAIIRSLGGLHLRDVDFSVVRSHRQSPSVSDQLLG